MQAALREIQKRVEAMMPPDSNHATKVAIVEDDDEIRAGWRAIINRMADYRCVADYGNAEDALAALPDTGAELVLMDINLPGRSGIDCTRELMRLKPSLAVIMLTMFGDRDNLFAALQAGACGYLLKRTTAPALKEALDQVRGGGAPMSPQIARQVVDFFQNTPPPAHPRNKEMESLAPRETEVLRLLAAGQPYKNIALQLELTLDTVRTYIRRIYKKLHVNSRTEAVVKFLHSEGHDGG